MLCACFWHATDSLCQFWSDGVDLTIVWGPMAPPGSHSIQYFLVPHSFVICFLKEKLISWTSLFFCSFFCAFCLLLKMYSHISYVLQKSLPISRRSILQHFFRELGLPRVVHARFFVWKKSFFVKRSRICTSSATPREFILIKLACVAIFCWNFCY